MRKSLLYIVLYLLVLLLLVCFALSKPCGYFRWPVKTLSDPVAQSINFNALQVSFSQFLNFDILTTVNSVTKRLPDEFQTYRILCKILRFTTELDGDIHIVVCSPYSEDSVFICELPAVVGCPEIENSFYFRYFKNSFDSLNLVKTSTFRGWSFYYGSDLFWITGVLFHDVSHSVSKGHAPHFIELHPVLSIIRKVN
jgi:hypothetical protein